MEQLHPLLRRQIAGEGPSHDVIELDAVNRRGRPVTVRVTVSSFAHGPTEDPGGAVVVMDPSDS